MRRDGVGGFASAVLWLAMSVSGVARAEEPVPDGAVSGPPGHPLPVAEAEPSAEREHRLCREIISGSSEPPLEALRLAENERWRAARTASRQGRKQLKGVMGAGPSAAGRGAGSELARIQDRYHRAVHEARVICDCRQRRGDPLREDCEAAFRALQARKGFAPPTP